MNQQIAAGLFFIGIALIFTIFVVIWHFTRRWIERAMPVRLHWIIVPMSAALTMMMVGTVLCLIGALK